MSRDTYGGMTTEGFDEVEASPHKSRTPTSYLSMPSVKAFPRYTITNRAQFRGL